MSTLPSSWCIDITHAQLVETVVNSLVRHCLGQYIGKLILRPNMRDFNNSCFLLFLDKVPINLNVLVLSCWTGLWAISHAALLSQYNFIACLLNV